MNKDEKPGLLKAYFEPLPAVFVFVGIVIAAVLHNTIGLLLGGILLFLSYIAASVVKNSPAFISKIRQRQTAQQTTEEKRERRRTVDKLDPHSRVHIKSILKSFQDIEKEIELLGIEGLGTEFTEMSLRSNLLLNRSMDLALRHSQLQSFLIKSNSQILKERISEIEANIASDPKPSTELQSLLALQKEEFKNINNAEIVSKNILSHLELIAATLGSQKSLFLSLKTKDARAALEARKSYSSQIETLSDTIDKLKSDILIQ